MSSLRNDAIGCKAESEHLLEMLDSKIDDADQRKEEAIDKYLEVKENMTPLQIVVFHNKVGSGDNFKNTGNAAYVRGVQANHSADNFFTVAEEQWNYGQWHKAVVNFVISTPRYKTSIVEYGMAESQHSAAFLAYDEAYAYAEEFALRT